MHRFTIEAVVFFVILKVIIIMDKAETCATLDINNLAALVKGT